MFEIHLPEGDPSVTLVSGRQRMEGPASRATRPSTRCTPSCRAGEVTADRAVAEWVVRAPMAPGSPSWHARADAGAVRTEVSLD